MLWVFSPALSKTWDVKVTNSTIASIPRVVTVSNRTSRLKSALQYRVSDTSGELLGVVEAAYSRKQKVDAGRS